MATDINSPKAKIGMWAFFFALFLLLSHAISAQAFQKTEDFKGVGDVRPGSGINSPVTVEVIYDNYVSKPGMKADWGFSVLIEGLDKEILFDTGTKPEIFEKNLYAMGIDPLHIEMLVLSHEHQDHTGGIPALVKMKTGIPMLFPHSFNTNFSEKMSELGFKPILVGGPSLLCQNLYTSGQFESEIPEEALVLDTKNGLVVLTGCAHPGIIMMLNKIKNDFGKNIYMVCGGFHLMNKTDEEMNTIISGMKNLGIVKCGATHCTGEKQIEMFREAFGENYFELGTGNRIVIN